MTKTAGVFKQGPEGTIEDLIPVDIETGVGIVFETDSGHIVAWVEKGVLVVATWMSPGGILIRPESEDSIKVLAG